MGMILKGSTEPITFLMVLSTDGKTAATGKTVSVEISKGGGAFAAVTNSVTEIGTSGFYKFTPTATETNTDGDFIIVATATGCDAFRDIRPVLDLAEVGAEMALETGAITAAVIASGAIDADAIATDAITAAKIEADAIGSSELATGAITAAVIATGAIDADAIATDAITAAKIAADAIGASELATGAIDEIVAGVWGADVSTYGAGTAGEALDGLVAGSAVVAADVADAVWDELLSGHVTAGSAAVLLARVGSEMTLEDAAITAAKFATGAIASGAFATDAITGSALAASAVAEIVDGVWLETLADHSGSSGSTAEALSQIGSVNPTAIADAVWDENLGGHTTANTAGAKLFALDPDNLTNMTGSSDGTRLVAQQGATFRYTLDQNLAIDTNWTRCVLSVKQLNLLGVSDESADLYMLVTNPADSSNDGVVTVNGNEADSEQRLQGSLAVDAVNNEVEIHIDEEITELVDSGTHRVAVKVEYTSGGASDEDIIHAGDFVFERHATAEAIE